MDMPLNPCTTSILHDNTDSKRLLRVVDRLSNIPDEVLIRIMSLLPTKDVAATCVLSKKLMRVLCLITTLDIDDSPISHCVHFPNKIHKFPSFVTFVNNVLQAHRSQYLTRFRLGVGSDMIRRYFYRCIKHCLPDVKPVLICSWISLPLTCCGLKELDLCIHVREPDDGHPLPPEIFTCQTLEVLKLDVNLPVDRVSTTFHLPLLKLLHLRVSHIYGDGSFVSSLVSSCPLLEDLMVEALLDHVQSIIISSPSLRIFLLKIYTVECDNTDFLCLDTPNLEYLHYNSNLAVQQSITNMDRLIQASINICDLIRSAHSYQDCRQQILGIMRCLTNVDNLKLLGSCLKPFNVDGLKDQLPMFRNLKYLELGNRGYNCWERVLEAFLICSPVLETLVFPELLIERAAEQRVHLEQQFCKRGLAIVPPCCKFHLRRIVIKNFYGNEREIGLIQFLLKHALVLEELLISQFEGLYPHFPIVDKVELQRTLQNLPRASLTCSIQVL